MVSITSHGLMEYPPVSPKFFVEDVDATIDELTISSDSRTFDQRRHHTFGEIVIAAVSAEGAYGRVAGVSSIQRCFTPTQRAAIGSRDGSRYGTRGFTSPRDTLRVQVQVQVHHVVPAEDGSPTDVDNGTKRKSDPGLLGRHIRVHRRTGRCTGSVKAACQALVAERLSGASMRRVVLHGAGESWCR